jgi:signal transduction histidine kinase
VAVKRWQRSAVAAFGLVLGSGLVALAIFSWHDKQQQLKGQRQRASLVLAELSLLPGEWDGPRLQGELQRWQRWTQLRFTVVGADGRVLADSQVPMELLPRLENHGGRPEVAAALTQGWGFACRRSLTTAQPSCYAAQRGRWGTRVVVVRAAWEAPQVPLPWGAVLALLALALASATWAGAWERRWGEALHRELEPWSQLPGEADALAVAKEADRSFRRLREALQRQLAACQQALELVSDGLVLVDREMRLVFANAAARELLGPLQETHVLWEYLRHPQLANLLAEPLRPGEARHAEMALGERTLAIKVLGLDHPLVAYALVLRDLTEKLQFDAARRAFVADLAHELRTPLAVLGGLAEELGLAQVDPRWQGMFRRQVERLARFAADLEELARVEAGTLELVLEPVELLPLLQAVAADMAAFAEKRQVHLEVRGKAVTLLTDRTRLAQVLGNLVDNAIRYNRPQGSVVLEVSPHPQGASLWVKDTGQGIPEGEVALVFQRFYRGRRAGETTGSGLGLALVKHLVARLGGTVTLKSQEGVGTEVHIVLPQAGPQGPAP